MGMHFGFVAVKGQVSDLRDAFALVWPERGIVQTEASFRDQDAVWAWVDENERRGGGAKGGFESQVCIFCQDGGWAILIDPTYVLASDDFALLALSRKFGTVLSFVIETAGGAAYFTCFQEGK